MTDKKIVVRFKPAGLAPQVIIADRAEFHGEHIVLLDAKGQCAALFLQEVVESWSEFAADADPLVTGAPLPEEPKPGRRM
jgi:hypothetical protein